jgi:hypothetical protein
MCSGSKSFALILILVITISSASLLMVKPTYAQTIPQPSVPEFSVKYIVYTIYVAPTYTINPYTGQNETTNYGQQVNNQTIQFTIKNQPFTPYYDSNGNYVDLYYNFRYKGHFGDTWSYYPFTGAYLSNPNEFEQTTHSYGSGGGPFIYYSASDSATTTISIPLSLLTPFPGGPEIPYGSQVDFELQAQVGQINVLPTGMLAGVYYNFTGQASDWSNTQTIAINDTSGSTQIITSQTSSPTISSTPTIPELSMQVILPLLLSVFSVAVIVRLRKANYA